MYFLLCLSALAADAGVGGFVGVQVGPAIPLSALSLAVTPRIEAGIELPPLDRSFRIFASAQYLRPVAAGSADDPRVPGGGFDYELKQDELAFAVGPSWRAGSLEGKVKPEVSVGPSVVLCRSTVNGDAGGARFPETTEQFTRVGVYASGGVGIALGPGELTLLVALGSSGLNGTITGESTTAAVSPIVGYRWVF